MGVTVKTFGKTKDKQHIFLYTIKNKNGMSASVTNFGAILVNLFVPDNNGQFEDVVLGLEKGTDYYKNGSFFGATVGRNANRIGKACAKIDGKLSSDNPFDTWTEAEETVFDFTPEQISAMEELDNSSKKGEVEIIKGKLRYRKDSKTGKGKLQFHLVKGDGTDLWAAYNPYDAQ